MTTITIDAAKTQLSKLIEQAERGEEGIIARQDADGPSGTLWTRAAQARLRWMKGKVWLDESFWEPLPEEELKLWEGG